MPSHLTLTDAHERLLQATGHALVLGGPGSGKTTVALLKARQRIEAGLAPAQGILFLSFSRAAVARVAEASRLEMPREMRHQFVIQTFHSFFWELVRSHGYLLGAPRRLAILLPHDERILRQSNGTTWSDRREELFREDGRVAFDLFAPKALALLRGSRKLRELVGARFPLIIVDEAQDTALNQWACVRELAAVSQLVCLADPEQMIYDFVPEVSSERLGEIITALQPVEVNLESRNHRSPGREIAAFGNDLLRGTPRGTPYGGVSRMQLPLGAADRDRIIRQSVGFLRNRIARESGIEPKSIAILASWNKGVAIIARALSGGNERPTIPHIVVTDEARVILASRVIASLLELAGGRSEAERVAGALELVASACTAKDGATARRQAQQLSAQVARLRDNQPIPRRGCAASLLTLIRELDATGLSGRPREDWLAVKRRLKEAGTPMLRDLAGDAEQLATLGLGRRIASGLSDAWLRFGGYVGAVDVLENAVTEDHLAGGTREWEGVSVMTIHKAKGREFDGVIVVDEPHSCPLKVVGDAAPYPRSRRLARVGVTRARHHVLLLTDPANPSPILQGHRL